jgi:hypothetical protein
VTCYRTNEEHLADTVRWLDLLVKLRVESAEDGGRVGLEHVISGARREFEQIGKLWNRPAAAISKV